MYLLYLYNSDYYYYSIIKSCMRVVVKWRAVC